MPEGGGQGGGGGGGHAVLEGSYELHDTVGTGGFAKVISRIVHVFIGEGMHMKSKNLKRIHITHFHATDSRRLQFKLNFVR